VPSRARRDLFPAWEETCETRRDVRVARERHVILRACDIKSIFSM